MLIHIPQIGLKEIRPGQVIESVSVLDYPYLKEVKEEAPTKRKYKRKPKESVNGEHSSTNDKGMGKLRGGRTDLGQPNDA